MGFLLLAVWVHILEVVHSVSSDSWVGTDAVDSIIFCLLIVLWGGGTPVLVSLQGLCFKVGQNLAICPD